MILQVEKLAESNKQFAQFLQDPSVPKKEKLSALEEILNKIQVTDTTKSLFGNICRHSWPLCLISLENCPPVFRQSSATCVAEVLAENNRLSEVPKIVQTFEELVASAKGQVKASITTAEVSPSSRLSGHPQLFV
jgi:F0F1-type ATP synthase delta subunit